MNGMTSDRLFEALVVGLAASAWYLVRRRSGSAPRSAYPGLAGNFAL